MNVYFFTKIIVTNPKCQITQQNPKGFQYFYSKQKRERQEQWQNYFTFSRVTSGKTQTWTPRTVQRSMSYIFYTSRENNTCSVSWSMNPSEWSNNLDQIFLTYDTSLEQTMTQMDSRPRKLRPRKLRPRNFRPRKLRPRNVRPRKLRPRNFRPVEKWLKF